MPHITIVNVEYNSNSTQFYCDQLTYNIAFWPISAWNTMLILGCGYFILICCTNKYKF
jgi:hypothetical protein